VGKSRVVPVGALCPRTSPLMSSMVGGGPAVHPPPDLGLVHRPACNGPSAATARPTARAALLGGCARRPARPPAGVFCRARRVRAGLAAWASKPSLTTGDVIDVLHTNAHSDLVLRCDAARSNRRETSNELSRPLSINPAVGGPLVSPRWPLPAPSRSSLLPRSQTTSLFIYADLSRRKIPDLGPWSSVLPGFGPVPSLPR